MVSVAHTGTVFIIVLSESARARERERETAVLTRVTGRVEALDRKRNSARGQTQVVRKPHRQVVGVATRHPDSA